jgi:hypothetical protein
MGAFPAGVDDGGPSGLEPRCRAEGSDPTDPLEPEWLVSVVFGGAVVPAQNAEMLLAPPAALARLVNAVLRFEACPWASAAS